MAKTKRKEQMLKCKMTVNLRCEMPKQNIKEFLSVIRSNYQPTFPLTEEWAIFQKINDILCGYLCGDDWIKDFEIDKDSIEIVNK